MKHLTSGQVFIVGMNGSGTTMLLDHLSSHSLLFGYPTETRFLPYYIKNQKTYGDLVVDKNFLRLWNDLAALIAAGVGKEIESIKVPENWRDQPRTTAGAFDLMMRQLAGSNGKQIWCEKTPMHVHHLGLLANSFPCAKFIHIIRDGRDCAASFHRRWKFNPVRTVYRWKHAVRAGRAQGAALGQRYLEVRYEAVTRAPESAFREMCDFLQIPFEDAILSTARSRSALQATHLQTVAVSKNRASLYFSDGEMIRMEGVAGMYLTELGYQCKDRAGDQDPARWKLRWWEITDDLRRLGGVLVANGRLVKPRNWPYIAGRVRRMLRQKATLRS